MLFYPGSKLTFALLVFMLFSAEGNAASAKVVLGQYPDRDALAPTCLDGWYVPDMDSDQSGM